MPSLFTHYLCGEKTLDLLKNKELKDMLLNHRQVFNLGTQGPDILFYYNVWPWAKSEGVEKIGEKMHAEKVNASFSSAVNYIMNQQGSARNILTAYMCGYACHYSLDSHTHPYIFYKTGFVRTNEAPTTKYISYHRTFETAVDVLMLDLMHKTRPFGMKASRLINVNSNQAQIVGEMYEKVLRDIYGIKLNTKHIQRAISDMASVQAVLRDRMGVKKKFLSWIEDKLGIYHLLSSMIYPSAVNDGFDYLNLSHEPWSHPWNNSVQYTASFTEMFDDAAKESAELCEVLYNLLSGQIDMDRALNRIGNRSFSTGIDCSIETEFRYYDCIYEQEQK